MVCVNKRYHKVDGTSEDDILIEYHGLGMIRSIMNIMSNMKG